MTRIDLLQPAVRSNPYPLYARMRREQPVFEIEPGGIFAASRHADVLSLFKSPQLFSSKGFSVFWAPPWLGPNPLARSMVVTDPPEHGKLRGLVNRGFGAELLARIEPRVRTIARDLTANLPANGEADFVAELGVLLPLLVICELLGLDPSQHRQFRHWADDLSAIAPVLPPERTRSICTSVADFEACMREVIERKRRAPQDDLVSELLGAQIHGERLTDDQLISTLFVLVPAGFETTTNLLGNMMLRLLERPADLRRLREDPASIPRFVEEVLRHDPPVHAVARLATRDTTLGGAEIPAGSVILGLIGSANRDEAVFPDPDRFDMDRPSDAKLSFGHGAHFCLGASLSRLEARLMLEALLARFSGFERTTEDIAWISSLTVRGPVALPLRFLAG
jgi:hypothetical protein